MKATFRPAQDRKATFLNREFMKVAFLNPSERWVAVERVPRSARPRDLRAQAWASLHRAVRDARSR